LPAYQTDLDGLRDLTHYTIQVDIDFSGNAFSGSEQVEITNTESAPLDRLYFRLLPNGGKSYGDGALSVSGARVDGDPVETRLSQGDTVLEIPLPEPLEVGGQVLVELDFDGVVPFDFGPVGAGGYGIYNVSDGVMALSGWYPILAVYDEQGWNLDPVSAIGDSVYSDSAFYTVDVTVPSDIVLATTGVLFQESGEAGALGFVSGPVRDFFMVMSPDYQIVSGEQDGVRVNSYYLPGHEQGGEATLEVALGSVQVYNQRFGRYPYVELDVVEAPMRNALGVEYPGIVLVSSDHYGDPSEFSFAVTTAHEVAHQWWYGLVGNDVFEEPWLDEALATYASNVYFQEAVGENVYRMYADYWGEVVQSLRQDGRDDIVTGSLDYFENDPRAGSYGAVVYDKGALFLKVLRDEIGDEAFFAALQDYFQDYRYGIATTEDLLTAFEAAAGQQLDDLYQEWLYSAEK
jgi:hypothetical protein